MEIRLDNNTLLEVNFSDVAISTKKGHVELDHEALLALLDAKDDILRSIEDQRTEYEAWLENVAKKPALEMRRM